MNSKFKTVWLVQLKWQSTLIFEAAIKQRRIRMGVILIINPNYYSDALKTQQK